VKPIGCGVMYDAMRDNKYCDLAWTVPAE